MPKCPSNFGKKVREKTLDRSKYMMLLRKGREGTVMYDTDAVIEDRMLSHCCILREVMTVGA